MDEETRFSCVICHFAVPLDDAALIHGGTCICLRCYERETGSGVIMSKELRRALIAEMGKL